MQLGRKENIFLFLSLCYSLLSASVNCQSDLLEFPFETWPRAQTVWRIRYEQPQRNSYGRMLQRPRSRYEAVLSHFARRNRKCVLFFMFLWTLLGTKRCTGTQNAPLLRYGKNLASDHYGSSNRQVHARRLA
ncbi:hypothetical protein LZ32DRAFT_455315 [Colletotrichum eremochloae]|nr:hypothetical protein LZ32DRAFT_455315 [Colletotrichum eremochloae]